MTLERIQKLAFRTISQIGISYRNSPLSETLPGLPDSAPRAGDRFPWLRLKFQASGPTEDLFQKLDDTRFNLIVVGQPSPPDKTLELGHLLRTHVIPDDPANDTELARAEIPRPSFYLLRPDGHVGLAGGGRVWAVEPGEQAARYLARSMVRRVSNVSRDWICCSRNLLSGRSTLAFREVQLLARPLRRIVRGRATGQ